MNKDKLKYKASNFEKAFNQLGRFCHKESLNEFELQGLIQCFEYTFELAWNTLKVYLAIEYFEDIKTPRDIIKKGFEINIIDDGALWLDALQKRNLMSHTYDEKLALEMEALIKNKYYAMIEAFCLKIKKEIEKL